jgi:hypothetical protein
VVEADDPGAVDDPGRDVADVPALPLAEAPGEPVAEPEVVGVVVTEDEADGDSPAFGLGSSPPQAVAESRTAMAAASSRRGRYATSFLRNVRPDFGLGPPAGNARPRRVRRKAAFGKTRSATT